MKSEAIDGVFRVVVPDDNPPVFADSAALARLRRIPNVDVQLFTERCENPYDLIDRISGAHTLIIARTTTQITNTIIESVTP